MGILDVASVLTQVPMLLKLKRGLKPRPRSTADCFARRVEANATRFSNRCAVGFEGNEVSWHELNAMANRFARYLAGQGVTKGDTVSVLMENRIEFIATVIALNKLGAIGGLINSNLTGKPLTHCITVTESKKCIFGAELTQNLADAKADIPLTEGKDYFYLSDAASDTPCPNWATDLGSQSRSVDASNLTETDNVTLGDNALYIFTSGTTGLPKAAVLSNARYLTTATLVHQAGLRCTEEDCIYICLPLYHGTGLIVGVGAALSSGAKMFVRRKFSASNFLPEVREQGATCLIYIGELCRYLTNSVAGVDDHKNPLKAMMGNGLRPDVWMDFKSRYGIKRVTEFYGASEGNVSFLNLLNKDQTVGMTSSTVALVQYDVDADEIVKDAQGRCMAVEPGKPGLLLGHINENAAFEGYTDPEATEKKVIRNAFEDGDAWFNSGDLLKVIDVGYSLGYPHYQFVDRVGDTYRWKSENVSTNEVGEIINAHPQVKFCNVYGVEIPGADGRAGMVAMTLAESVEQPDINSLGAHILAELPAYARPVFVRIQPDIDVTGTFKMVKGELRKEAYDLTQVGDPIYVLKPGTSSYELLTPEFATQLTNGDAGY
jgi:citronellyl-CoA synthetase